MPTARRNQLAPIGENLMSTAGPSYLTHAALTARPSYLTHAAAPLPSIRKKETGTSMSPPPVANTISTETQTNNVVKVNTQPYEFTKNDLLCPITQSFMEDPVLATDGHTYERKAILGWAETVVGQAFAAGKCWDEHGFLREGIVLESPVLGRGKHLLLQYDNPYAHAAVEKDEMKEDDLLKPLLFPNVLCKKITEGWTTDNWQKTACEELKKDINTRVDKIRDIMTKQEVTLEGNDAEFYKYLENFRKNKTRKNNRHGLVLDTIKNNLSRLTLRGNKKSAVAPFGGSKKIKSIKERKQMKRGGTRKKKR